MFIYIYLTLSKKTDLKKLFCLIHKEYMLSSQHGNILIPFTPNIDEIDTDIKPTQVVHVRISQRTARAKITTIEGLPNDIDHKKLCQFMQKEFNCGKGKVEKTDDFGTIIQLSGDQREKVAKFLVREGIVDKKSSVKIHGY